jgi:subtilisin
MKAIGGTRRRARASGRGGRRPRHAARATIVALAALLLALPGVPAPVVGQDPSSSPSGQPAPVVSPEPEPEQEPDPEREPDPGREPEPEEAAPREDLRPASPGGGGAASAETEPPSPAGSDPSPAPEVAPRDRDAEQEPDGPAPEGPAGTDGDASDVIVTLNVPDATRAIDASSRIGRARAGLRAGRSQRATRDLERSYGFKARERYAWALAGFSARLTPAQVRRLRRDPQVAAVRPARRFRLAAQTVPAGLVRVSGQPSSGPPLPDVDVDVGVIDTGIGPVGGGELNVAGGVNCSGDKKGVNAWQDVYPSRHGTHVAGIIGARHNGLGIVGVAPGARLWSLRVFDQGGYGDESTVLCALEWAVRTHTAPPPGSQPIEVVNMSLVGPVLPNTPAECGVPTDPDASHVAVCNAVAAGISVVVAAGNAASNAKGYAPASYDQAITVAAISDFDGLPGGLSKPTCGSTAYGAETDDTFARYSNRGADVDIVAPGTCIVSTYPSAGGGSTQRLTGTSMATPYVAGAAALLLAAAPGTPPERVRELLIASGDLDWEATSDPDWQGPASPGGPRRLLDVAALTSSQPGIALWLVPGRAIISAKTGQATMRVDLQRIGGYEDEVVLGTDGLGTGIATWQPGSLTGLAATAARLTLGATSGIPDGTLAFQVTGTGTSGGPSALRGAQLLLDRTPPAIKGPSPRLVQRRLTSRGEAPVAVTWSARDAQGDVRRAVIQRSVAGGGWKTMASSPAGGSTIVQVPARRWLNLRVRATDAAGNAGTSGTRARLRVLDPAALELSGGWRTAASSPAGGTAPARAGTGGSARATFTGQGVGVVAPVGPGMGEIRVRVDGGGWTRVRLSRTSRAPRMVVYTRSLAPGTHSVEIEVLKGPVTLDSVLVLR